MGRKSRALTKTGRERRKAVLGMALTEIEREKEGVSVGERTGDEQETDEEQEVLSGDDHIG